MRAALSARGKPANRYDWRMTSSTSAGSTRPRAASIIFLTEFSSSPAIAAEILTSRITGSDDSATLPVPVVEASSGIGTHHHFADGVPARVLDRLAEAR